MQPRTININILNNIKIYKIPYYFISLTDLILSEELLVMVPLYCLSVLTVLLLCLVIALGIWDILSFKTGLDVFNEGFTFEAKDVVFWFKLKRKYKTFLQNKILELQRNNIYYTNK